MTSKYSSPGDSAPLHSPRARRRKARIDQILGLAMRQIESRGLDGLTLQEIARELDYSVPALYRYFPSKDALVAELQRRVVALLDQKLSDVLQRTQTWLSGQSETDRKRFGALAPIVSTALFYGGLARTAPQAFGLLSASLGDPRHLIEDAQARAVIATAQPMFDGLAGALARAGDAQELDPGDAGDRALLLWSSLHGVAQLTKLERLAPDRPENDQLCDFLLETLLVGWGADRDRAAKVILDIRSTGLAQSTVGAEDLRDFGASEAA